MKSLLKASSKKWMLFAVISLSVFSACQKQIDQLKKPEETTSAVLSRNEMVEVKTINVSNLEQLYEAVNNPANTDSRIILAPGTYILNPNHPNAGRLELLENMQLQGQPGHPEFVIIDASALPGTSFTPPLNFPAPRTGAIRIGRGFNSIEWLTVKGNAAAQALSVIDTDLIWPGVSRVRVAHSIVTGGRIGIDIRNVSAASIGRTLEAEIANNEISENLVQFGQGIEIQNANGATSAIIRASLKENNVHGNKVGLRAFNNAANSSVNDGIIKIESAADQFNENGIGVYLSAGLNQATSSTANENFLSFYAFGTSIMNNQGALPPDAPAPPPACGIYAAGGISIVSGIASYNKLEMNLSGCRISGNNGTDIISFGAFSYGVTPAGIDNVVEIKLNGVSKQTEITTTPSLPIEPAATNTVSIFR